MSLTKDLDEIKSMIKDLKKELRGLIEINQRLIHERLGVTAPPPPKEYGEDSVPVKMEITDAGPGFIKISGSQTYDFKSKIKEAAPTNIAKWDGPTKSWKMPGQYLDQLIKNLESVNLKKDKDFKVLVKNTFTKEEPKEESEEIDETETSNDADDMCKFR